MLFAIQADKVNDFEEKVIKLFCMMNNIPYKIFIKASDVQSYPNDYIIPFGSTKWFELCTNWKIIPNYYPEFLSSWLGRKVWQADSWPLNQKVFIKPADSHKRFNGRITTGGYHGKKRGPYWCSEIVHFVDEWRYYIADGKVIYAGWYIGSTDEDKPAPDLDISWPTDYTGAVDFGRTDDNRILLIEAHEPYSCGWYGRVNDYQIYGNWVIKGWDYLKNKYSK